MKPSLASDAILGSPSEAVSDADSQPAFWTCRFRVVDTSSDSPEVRPVMKRQRIVDYESSPASLFNQDEPIESPSPVRTPMPSPVRPHMPPRRSPPPPLLPAITLRTHKSQDQISRPAHTLNSKSPILLYSLDLKSGHFKQ